MYSPSPVDTKLPHPRPSVTLKAWRGPLIPLVLVQHISALQSPAVPGTLLCLRAQKDVAPAYSGCASLKTDCPELPVYSCPLSAGCAMLSLVTFGLPDQLPHYNCHYNDLTYKN